MKSETTHIAILCSRIDLPGGIERAVVNTANLFAQKGHAVSLIILDETEKSFYPIHSSITIIQQSLSFGITPKGNIISRKIKLLSDVLKLKKIIKLCKADVVISSEYPFTVAAVLARAKKYTRLYSWEHHHYFELSKNKFWNKMIHLGYPKLDGIVTLNKDEQRLFERLNKNPIIIENFVSPSQKNELANKLILTVGRLTSVKGTDNLLRIAKQVLENNPDWQWKLIGEGDMKELVTDFIEKEKLQNRLILQTPVTHEIQQEYQSASIYVMTSRHECFPMTLLEAQSTGLPCIAFDCETGPRHIIQNNIDGILVEKESVQKMADAITLLISNEEKRKEMGEAAFQNVQRFSPENIYEKWKLILK